MPRQFKLARKMKNIPLKDAAKDLGVAAYVNYKLRRFNPCWSFCQNDFV